MGRRCDKNVFAAEQYEGRGRNPSGNDLLCLVSQEIFAARSSTSRSSRVLGSAPWVERFALGELLGRGQVVHPDVEPGQVLVEEWFDLAPGASGEAAADARHVDEGSRLGPTG